ncbi:MAG: prenyltransferase [Woeseiaceae bacterium]|nr:prenyltransferase [Woeseiaceae bacterium]
MTATNNRANPLPEDFSGDSFGSAARRMLHASRPKFFTASILPVLFGTAWGVQISGGFDVLVFVLALFATVCVHAASNVLNDVGDDDSGTDPQNVDRVYPYTGGSRFIQTGIMTSRQMAMLGISQLTVAAVAGLVLIYLKGPIVLYFGLAGMALAVLYSLGPARLSSLGVGEGSIGIAFGIIPVTGAAWLQGAPLDVTLLLVSLPISAWVAAIVLINEVPDIAADGGAGKRTLPVRFGLAATALIYLSLHIGAAAVTGWLTFRGVLPLAAPVGPVLLLLLAIKASGAIQNGVEDRQAMTKAIESTLAIHLIGSLWLVGCALYLHWWGAT